MTDSGCQQCGENTFSGDGASSCTSCPEGKISAAGSTSEDDCEYGKFGVKLQNKRNLSYKMLKRTIQLHIFSGPSLLIISCA